jgi:DNA-directed RNA polymerase subunit RPC12/RpoP
MILQKLREFMYGRYGTDQLSLALIGGGFVFYVLYVFTRSRLLYLISLVLYGIAVFRTLSKNTVKRRIENQKFMSLWYKLKNKWVGIRADFEERKTYKHFKCPACGQKIRIPKGRGKVEIRCPKCSHKFVKKA